jgi:uncharacterized protein (TIGR02444 family)
MSGEQIANEAGVLKQYWEEIKELWGRPGVADICLELQAGFGTGIVLLLFMRLLDHHAIFLTEAECMAAEDAVGDWHKHVTQPLRLVRQWMKPRAQTSAIAALRDSIKDAELEAERIELDLLVDWLAGRNPGFEPASIAGNSARVLLRSGVDRRSIERFLKLTE